MIQSRNTIRTYALVAVTAALAFIMGMSWWLTTILSAPDWCGRAINAEKLSEARATSAVELCKDLLMEQVGSLATNSHIYAFSIGIVLIALMLIVVAGGRLSFKASKTGIEGDLSRDDEAVPVEVVNASSDPVPVESTKGA